MSRSGHKRATSWQVTTHPALQPSPVDIPNDAYWTCQECDAPNRFVETSLVRPLGHVKCLACNAVITSLKQISNMEELTSAQCPQFMVSLPAGHPGPPKSLFVSVCCHCGRSHLRRAKEMERPKTPELPPPPKEKFRDKVLKNLGKLKLQKEEEHEYLGYGLDEQIEARRERSQALRRKVGTEPRFDGPEFEERKSYTVVFDKECTCGYVTCVHCLKFKVVAEGEWVAQSFGVTYGAINSV